MAMSGPSMSPSSALDAADRRLAMAALSEEEIVLVDSFWIITSLVASRLVTKGPLLQVEKFFCWWK